MLKGDAASTSEFRCRGTERKSRPLFDLHSVAGYEGPEIGGLDEEQSRRRTLPPRLQQRPCHCIGHIVMAVRPVINGIFPTACRPALQATELGHETGMIEERN